MTDQERQERISGMGLKYRPPADHKEVSDDGIAEAHAITFPNGDEAYFDILPEVDAYLDGLDYALEVCGVEGSPWAPQRSEFFKLAAGILLGGGQ